MSTEGPPQPTRGATGIRARNRAAIEAEILRVARLQLAEVGAAALSVRAVARDLQMASSAVYRYVASRDDLLTLLIVAAYDQLGDEVDAALSDLPAPHADDTAGPAHPDVLRRRFAAICHALRRWAVANPHDYALVYGSPVPSYDAPAERTNEPGTRVVRHLTDLLLDRPEEQATALVHAAAGLGPFEQDPFFAGRPPSGTALVRGLAAWSLVLGALSSELFGQLGGDLVADPEAFFSGMVALASDVAFG